MLVTQSLCHMPKSAVFIKAHIMGCHFFPRLSCSEPIRKIRRSFVDVAPAEIDRKVRRWVLCERTKYVLCKCMHLVGVTRNNSADIKIILDFATRRVNIFPSK